MISTKRPCSQIPSTLAVLGVGICLSPAKLSTIKATGSPRIGEHTHTQHLTVLLKSKAWKWRGKSYAGLSFCSCSLSHCNTDMSCFQPGLHGLQTSIREKSGRGSTFHPWVATGLSWSIHDLQENYVAYSFLSCSGLLIFISHTIFNKGRQSTYRTHSRPHFSTFIVLMVTWDCLG